MSIFLAHFRTQRGWAGDTAPSGHTDDATPQPSGDPVSCAFIIRWEQRENVEGYRAGFSIGKGQLSHSTHSSGPNYGITAREFRNVVSLWD